MNENKAVGQRLKSGLADRGMTFSDLGEAIGVGSSKVANWVSGRTPIKIVDAIAICDILDWPLDKLACRNE